MEILNSINWNIVADIAIAFGLKLMDNMLGTAKTIYISKEKYLIGSVFNGLSSFFYLVAIVRIAKTTSISGIIAMSIATFIGTLIPGVLVKKSEKDKLYIFDITADSISNGKAFADKLRELNMPVRTEIVYDKYMKKTLACKVYCQTKEQSKTVNGLINPEFKYNVYIPIHE